MLIVRPRADGTFEELPPRDTVVGEGASAVTIPFENFAIWMSAGVKQAHGLYLVATPQAPAGKTRTGYTLGWSADKAEVVYQPTYEDAPKPVPQSVSRRQMLLALNATGRLSTVQNIVAGASLTVQISWNEASYFDRTDSLLLSMANAQGWTSADLDALFVLAATL